MNSKIIVFATMAVGLLVALFLGMAVGEGRRMHIVAVFAVMAGAPLLLSLGKNYWYLIPASILSGLPAIPFGGRNIDLAELCIALCFAIFITRVAFKLDKIVFWRLTHIPIYLFFAWVLFVFCIYPVGLAVFGASTMGARFYIKIVLAFMAFMIIASRDIKEKDCKWVVIFIVCGSCIMAAYNIVSFLLFGPGDEILNPAAEADGFYTWHQSLSIPALSIVFLLFAWKKPRDILGFRNPSLLILYILAIGLVLFSGKRLALLAVFLAPLVSAVIYRQYSYLLVGAIGFSMFSLAVIFGHGDLFRFPLTVQRTLSWLPARWDPEFQHMAAGRDPFREALRRFAMENIERHPIVGRGFAIEYSEIIGQIGASRYLGGDDMQAAPYAIGRSWHNTWLGYAADFGIPLSVIQGILYLTVLVVAFKASRACPTGSLSSLISIYILIYTARDIIGSHTGGHSAFDPFDRWWMYGLLFAIYSTATAKLQKPFKTKNPRDAFLERLAKNKPQPVDVRS